MLLMAASRYWLVCQASLAAFHPWSQRPRRKPHSVSDMGRPQISVTRARMADSSSGRAAAWSRSPSRISWAPAPRHRASSSAVAAALVPRRSAKITSAREANSSSGRSLSKNS